MVSDSTVAAEGIGVFYISKHPLVKEHLAVWHYQ